MVTMSSEKCASRRNKSTSSRGDESKATPDKVQRDDDKTKAETSTLTTNSVSAAVTSERPKLMATCAEDSPNYLVYKKVRAKKKNYFTTNDKR